MAGSGQVRGFSGARTVMDALLWVPDTVAILGAMFGMDAT